MVPMMPSIATFFMIMVLVSCLGQVSSDLYLPSLPAISLGLGTTDNLTQLSISLFMFGYSFSQLIYGPVSDAVGRRKPLLIGLVLCIIGGIACVFSSNIYFLICARLFQGLGAGASMALSRSITRDRCSGNELASFSTYLAILNVFVMASAPVIGGYVQHYWGWQSSFVLLSGYAIVAFFIVFFMLPETSKHIDSTSLKLNTLKNNFKQLLTHREFVGYSACIFLAYASVLAWVTVSPMLLQNVIGLSPVQFGWVAVLVGLAFITGGLCNALFVKRFGHLNMMRFGIVIKLIAAILMLFFGLTGHLNFYAVIVPLFIFLFGAAFIFPNTFAGALTPFAQTAGMAGALFGFAQTVGGAISSFIVSYLPDNNQIPIAAAFLVYALMAMAVSFGVLGKKEKVAIREPLAT